MSVKIGNITLEYGLMLAPMAGVTDRAFRRICRRHGAEYTVTEMVSVKGLHYNEGPSLSLARLMPEETPAAVQLFGHEPALIPEAIAKVTSVTEDSTAPTAIDLNFGCPMKKIVANGDGSALMKDPALIGRLVRAASDATSLPITVKIRCGWDDSSLNAPQIAAVAEENGASLICVHGRTREDMYGPRVRRDVIRQVKAAVKIPVIANGGIFTAEDGRTMLEETGCDGLMIGRGAMGNPWLFEALRAGIKGEVYRLPDLDVRIGEALSQVRDMIADKGEHTGVLEARRHLSYYIHDEKGAADTRAKLNAATTYEEMENVLSAYLRNARSG